MMDEYKRERLTHAQRREQTRERLLEAARTTFVEKGLVATSVEDIAEAAGYTRGAFYSNFGGKPELLIELLQRGHDRAQAGLRALMEARGTREQMTARVIEYCSRYLLDRDSFPLWVEAKLLASRDTGFRECFNVLQQEKLEQISTCIRTFFECDGNRLPMQADAIAGGLVSLCDGVQLFGMCDRQRACDEVMQTTLAGFFSCVLLPQQVEEIRHVTQDARVPDSGCGQYL